MALAWDSESVQARILQRVQSKASWAQILADAATPRLLQGVGDEIGAFDSQAAFYTREQAWSTARNRSTLVAGAKRYNYKAHRMIGATGYVRVSAVANAFSASWLPYFTYPAAQLVTYNGQLFQSLQAGNVGNIPSVGSAWWQYISTSYQYLVGIPQWATFKSVSGLSYVSTAASNLTPSMDWLDVPVVQGTYKSVTFSAQGIPNEEFFLSDPNVDNKYYYLYVNNVLWTEVDAVLSSGPTDQVFETENKRDFSGVYFTVGDGVNGAMLNPGDTVTVRYVRTNGSAGNVTSTNTVTTVGQSFTDINGNTVILFCSNTSSLAGGQDYESIESIRDNAPANLQAGNALTYETGLQTFLLDNFAFIGQCVVWGAYEQNIDQGLDPSTYIPADQNLAYIAAITPGPSPLDILVNPDGSVNNAYKSQIIQATYGRKGFTDLYAFRNVQFVYLALVSALAVQDSAPALQSVITNVQQYIISGFTDPNGKVWTGLGVQYQKFKQPIYTSQLDNFISSIPFVDHHTSFLEVIGKGSFNTASALPYFFNIGLPLYPVRQGTVSVEVVDQNGVTTQIASDASGSLTAAPGIGLSAISLTYATGGLSFTVTSGLSESPSALYSVKVYYRPSADDILPSSRTQILFLEEVNQVTAAYV